jgi:hypothetical protein
MPSMLVKEVDRVMQPGQRSNISGPAFYPHGHGMIIDNYSNYLMLMPSLGSTHDEGKNIETLNWLLIRRLTEI